MANAPALTMPSPRTNAAPAFPYCTAVRVCMHGSPACSASARCTCLCVRDEHEREELARYLRELAPDEARTSDAASEATGAMEELARSSAWDRGMFTDASVLELMRHDDATAYSTDDDDDDDDDSCDEWTRKANALAIESPSHDENLIFMFEPPIPAEHDTTQTRDVSSVKHTLA